MSDQEQPGFQHNIQQLHKRVGTLETDVASLSSDMGHVLEDVREMNHSFEVFSQNMSRSIDNISQKISEESKPKMQIWVSAIGVVLIILSMFGSGYIRDLGRVELKVLEVEKAQLQMIRELGDFKSKDSEFEWRLRAIERELFKDTHEHTHN